MENFLKAFKIEKNFQYSNNYYKDYYDHLGGMQFGNGLYTAFQLEDVPKWKEYIVDVFPRLEGKILPVGYSWDGVIFSLDLRDGKIIVTDVDVRDCFAIPCSLRTFLNKHLAEDGYELLNGVEYEKWMKKNGKLEYGSCVGYRIALCLGGEDGISNREVCDLEVYWCIFGQIIRQVIGDK